MVGLFISILSVLSVLLLVACLLFIYYYQAPPKTKRSDDKVAVATNKKDKNKTHPKLHYEIFGNGPIHIVYIVGFATGWQWWYDNVIHLQEALNAHSEKFSILVFDNAASGKSYTPRGLATPKMMARDAWELVLGEHVGWRKVHLIGQSMGGLIAQEMVQLFNERNATAENRELFGSQGELVNDETVSIESVSLFNTFVSFYHIPYGLPLLSAMKFVALSPFQRTNQKLVGHVLKQMFSAEFLAKEYAALEEKFKGMFHSSSVNTIGSVKQFLGMMVHFKSANSFVEQFRRLKKPVLIVCSSGDIMVAHRNSLEMFRLLNESNPNFTVTLEMVEGAGHIVNSEAAERVNDLLYKKWLIQNTM